MAIGVNFEDTQTHQREICVAEKLVQKPFNLNSKRATSMLELVHSNVCQVEDLSIGEAKYYITFLDDHSRKIFVYFLKQKDEVPDIVKKFIKLTEKQTGHKV